MTDITGNGYTDIRYETDEGVAIITIEYDRIAGRRASRESRRGCVYVEVALRRWERFSGQTAVRVDG